MKKFSLMLFVTIVFIFSVISGVNAQGVPLPFRIGGSVTIDGVLLTQANDDGLVITVTKADGSNYTDSNNNHPQDIDGLNASSFYLIDVPIFSASHQPGGANPGDTAKLHVFKNGKEFSVTGPANGSITIGAEGAVTQINIVSTTPAPVPPVATAVPTMTEWGMMIFMISAGLTSLYYLKSKNNS